MKPSMHLVNCKARCAEIEEHAPLHYDQDAFRAATYRETALVYAALADTENKERILERRTAATVRNAINVLRAYPAEELSIGQIKALVEITLDIMSVEPAFGGDAGMCRISKALRQHLKQAEEAYPPVLDSSSDAAEALREFDRTEAAAINADMRVAA